MFRLVMSAIFFVSSVVICACGSNNGSGTTASGNTVIVSSGISPSTSGSVFGNISSNGLFAANPISITLTSVARNPSSSIPTSPVTVKSINMSLVPLAYASQPVNVTNALSPIITNPQYATIVHGLGGVIPGPGSLKIDGIDLIGLSDGSVMRTHFNSSGFVSVQYKYLATLHFNCIESNSGVEFTVSNPVGIQVDLP